MLSFGQKRKSELFTKMVSCRKMIWKIWQETLSLSSIMPRCLGIPDDHNSQNQLSVCYEQALFEALDVNYLIDSLRQTL